MPNIPIGTTRAQLNDLLSTRASLLDAANAALSGGNTTEYHANLDKAKAMNAQIDDLKAMVTEFDRYDIAHAPTYGSDRHDLEEMGKALAAGERADFRPRDVLQAIRTNSVNFSGSLVAPTGGSSQINDGTRTQVSTLVNQVRVETFDGLNAWEEAYLKTMLTATDGKPATVAGTARTESTPVWKRAKLMAHEVQTTAFVDRNIARLSPADYAGKCQEYALKALLRKVNELICNGDSATAPSEVFGIINAKNTDSEAIFATAADVTATDADTLRALVFGYGGDEEVAANARLILSKKSLDAFGKVKIKTGDNRKLYEITQAGNTGTIKEGGLIVPYTICSSIGDSTLAYGDPYTYLLALFGAYSIRVDESVKAVERQVAILGDVLCGGNLTADGGFLVASLT